MSAFVVSELTIRRVVALLVNGEARLLPSVGGILTDDYENADRIGNTLWALNVQAVNGRYPNDAPEQVPTYVHRHLRVSSGAARIDAYKALLCLIYQCCEDVTKDAPLLAELKDAAARLAHQIISDTPEFADSKAWQ